MLAVTMWQIRQDPGRNGKRPRRALISHGARTILHEDSRSFIAPIPLSGRNPLARRLFRRLAAEPSLALPWHASVKGRLASSFGSPKFTG
jgi:hypothetical protein